MVDKKGIFVAFLDDDNSKKEVWVDYLEEDSNSIRFGYQGEYYIIPMHRVLKVKRRSR